MRKHWVPAALVGLLIAVVYTNVSGAYFCGYDDFADVQRAAFEDARTPSHIFTTTHFGTPKYRPLQRGLTYLNWHFGGHGAVSFRIRNLAFHILGALMVYGIVWLLSGAILPSAGAGLLFGLHPLANQSVAAAIWANTTAYGLLLTALFLFLYALQGQPRWRWALAGAFLVELTSLFVYESTIVVFGFVFAAIILWWWKGRPFPRGYLVGATGAAAGAVLALFLVRKLFVANAMPVTPLPAIAKNLSMYLGVLALPVDLLFANSLLGTPLPPEIRFTKAFLTGAAIALIVTGALAAVILRLPALRGRWRLVDWPQALFFVACILMALLPFLVFTDHASETYLYLPTAFYAMLVSLVLWRWLPRRAYQATLAVLLCGFAAATFLRNERVEVCGGTAEKILSELPWQEWREGSPRIELAPRPEDVFPLHYGLYNYRGIYTIELPEAGVRGAEQAAQILSGNDRVHVDVVEPQQMALGCPAGVSCFWVSASGDVAKAP